MTGTEKKKKNPEEFSDDPLGLFRSSKLNELCNNFPCPAPVGRCFPWLVTAACRSPSSVGCSSPPGQAVVLRACDGARGATAAPWPASGVQQTGHAWPAAGGLRTWAAADLLVGPVGMEYRRLGGAASRVHAAAGRGEGWGWRRAGKGSEPGEVLLPGGPLPVDGPPSLEDTQDIHHHLDGEGLAGGGGDVSEYASAGGGVA